MQVFPMAPVVNVRTIWLALPIVALVVATVAVAVAMLSVGSARFEVSREGLRLRGDWYGRFIPVSELVAADARRVDLTVDTALQPVRRTMGTGMPGYQAGWFLLANGEKALLYLTDRRKAVYVPTTGGYSVLLSPGEPEAFLAALHAAR